MAFITNIKDFKLDRVNSVPHSSGLSDIQKIHIVGKSTKAPEAVGACKMFTRMMEHRNKYVYTPKRPHPDFGLDELKETSDFMETLQPKDTEREIVLVDGVFFAPKRGEEGAEAPFWADAARFFALLDDLIHFAESGAAKTLAYNRLSILAARFDMHVLMNEASEFKETMHTPHRDFYNIYKVDNHVHHSACMNQKQFLKFMKKKMRTENDVVVAKNADGKLMTLDDVMNECGIKVYNLSIDVLDMHAHKQTFQRFDKFNQKYNPVGSSLLRTIFLKTTNHINGRYLAEITKEVFALLKEYKYQCTEYRLSIYGRNEGEWDRLAAWVVDNGLQSPKNVWLIQVPRLFEVYKDKGLIRTFQDMLSLVFRPIFEATLDPASNPKLAKFLKLVGGFDCVDDESVIEHVDFDTKPADWDGPNNPRFSVYIFYIFANLRSLNELRESKGLNTFSLRPHSGEAGSLEHLATTYLLANSINHGVLLKKTPVLYYLYYLSQVGLSLSPLSNNILFVKLNRNPFLEFFRTGLNVALSTDDPLMIHFTKDPLIEEYSIAAQVWNLSKTDLSEIAANSVYQSAFDERVKEEWYGKGHGRFCEEEKLCHRKNLPKVRVNFRKELLNEELYFVSDK